MDGPDKCYPIVMHEVRRSRQVAKEVEAEIKGAPLHQRAYKEKLRDPRSMNQERAWFDRKDVTLGTSRGEPLRSPEPCEEDCKSYHVYEDDPHDKIQSCGTCWQGRADDPGDEYYQAHPVCRAELKRVRMHDAFWEGVIRARKWLVQGGGRNELGAELGHLQHGSDAEQAEWRGLVMFWEHTSKRPMATLEGLMRAEGLTMTDFLDKLEEIESPVAA